MRLTDDDRALPPQRGSRSKGSKTRGTGSRHGFIFRLVKWCFVLAIWGAIAIAGYVGYVALRMPQASTWDIPQRPPNVRIIDRNGFLIANRGTTGGEALSLKEMSPWIPKAVVAIEDRRFYDHYGVDPIGIARAMVTNIIHSRSKQGGSTLTQQLAKNLFLSPDRTLERKVQEALLALWLEHKYTKDQILEMYLNRVYLGSGAYGVEAASRRYFGKSAKDVDLMEAATLAGLLKAPSRLSPARDPKAANDRAKLVLAAMKEEGMVNNAEVAMAEAEPMAKAESYWTGSENYVADQVVQQLPFLIGETDKDIVVETTLDMTLERAAEEAIRTQISENGEKRDVSQGALVSIDKSGAIRAMVGGVDYAQSQFNRATDAKRQPGSTFKPFVYLAALEAGRTPNTIRNDAPVRIGNWTPRNYGGKYMGEVTLTTALSHSLNSVAAQLIMEVGTDKVIEVAHRLGIHSALSDNASIALGTSEVSLLELTGAFVPFANGGYKPQLRLISKVEDTNGKTIYDFGEITANRVVEPDIVGMMNAMLEQTVENGTARKAAIDRPSAGKTGTSQDFRDAWFIGYTTDYVTGIWFGNDDGHPMKTISGGSLPVRAWKSYMTVAEKSLPVSPLPGNYNLQNAVPGGNDILPESEQPSTTPYPAPPPEPGSSDDYWAPRPQADVNGGAQPVQTKKRSFFDFLRGR
ncbi:transglycosylase domain-containing protein [Bartonella apis]|uniref:Penicillin-binding protein 1A n=1 Tax=Bartonella apis TaxID=1686310 RepID=A0A1R0FCB2_9HYPH|nr:transglycosylase domain-containing protein [Bartonella apis]MCT6824132.1 penicillin-binding protein [Bartonella apis]MCT6860311.1 penicillin-binding protein [Bartonella apis]OLY44595.1 penicillin-binding protein 1A [Bartonella apis]